MKIIKPAPNGENWSVEVYCTGYGNDHSGCGALLEVLREDLRYYPGVPGDSWGSKDPAVTMKCVCCGALTDLGTEFYPPNHKRLKRYTKSWAESGDAPMSDGGDK